MPGFGGYDCRPPEHGEENPPSAKLPVGFVVIFVVLTEARQGDDAPTGGQLVDSLEESSVFERHPQRPPMASVAGEIFDAQSVVPETGRLILSTAIPCHLTY
jgi:hypothetical protein